MWGPAEMKSAGRMINTAAIVISAHWEHGIKRYAYVVLRHLRYCVVITDHILVITEKVVEVLLPGEHVRMSLCEGLGGT